MHSGQRKVLSPLVEQGRLQNRSVNTPPQCFLGAAFPYTAKKDYSKQVFGGDYKWGRLKTSKSHYTAQSGEASSASNRSCLQRLRDWAEEQGAGKQDADCKSGGEG